ncbi:MAG: hypothetical protein HKN03_09010 [Acidimicrobiales bacterium]|nr:hypothetical protein [Acidimicrobiales bacterium]
MEFDPFVAAAIAAMLGVSPAGVPADRPDLHGDLPGLPAALGRGVARIHATPIPAGAAPFDIQAAIRDRLAAGLVMTRSMPQPYDRYSAQELGELFERLPGGDGGAGAPTCVVGRLTLDRILLAGGEVCGIGGGELGLLVDPHLDLAVLHHSIHTSLGPEAVFGFYEAYGSDPSLVLLDRYVMAAHLLGWMPNVS